MPGLPARSSILSEACRCTNALNGGSFQQEAMLSVAGWQYVAWYTDVPGRVQQTRHVCLGRRRTTPRLAESVAATSDWQVLVFDDYDQTEDDGHNTISLGACVGDGTLHLSFDLHDTPLVYRHSLVDLTSDPKNARWSVESFSSVVNVLPGLEQLSRADYFENVTYPRFLGLPAQGGALLFEFRIGISGLGDDLIFIYARQADGSWRWTKRGTYLKGVGCNAYINGVDVDAAGALRVSWTWRDYMPVTLEQSRQQAGPNGPENNHDLLYACSPAESDGSGPGLTWLTADGIPVGTADERPILPSSEGIVAFALPKHSGILNQEAQCVDAENGFHVLNREAVGGVETWFLYSLDAAKPTWTRCELPVLPPSLLSARGKICYSPDRQTLLALLPTDDHLVLLERPIAQVDAPWTEVDRLAGAGGNEVLYDRNRLADGVLSLFLGRFLEADGRRVVKVIDLALV